MNNLSLKCLDVTNSPSRPAKGPSLTLKVIETVGSSISTNGIFSTFNGSHIVSPMFISAIPDNSIISPALASNTSTLSKPWWVYTFAIFPFIVLSSFLHIVTFIPVFTIPRSSLPTAILPT